MDHLEGVKRVYGIAVAVAVVVGLRLGTSPAWPQLVHAPVVAGSQTPVQHGREVYERYGCILCHGSDGKGGFANPNSETDGKVPGLIYVGEGYKPSELRSRILDGTPVVGRANPKGPRPPYRMPGWRGQMTAQEADDLVQYLIGLLPKSTEQRWH